MRLIFDRPEAFVLLVDKQEVHGGESFDVSDERGQELLKQRRLHLREVAEPEAKATPADPKPAPAKAAPKAAAVKAAPAQPAPADKPAAAQPAEPPAAA